MAEFLELLDALRATRDADSCLRGLNLFRKGLRGEDGPAFLVRYLRQSPDWQELQAVWDTQLTVSTLHQGWGRLPPAAAGACCHCRRHCHTGLAMPKPGRIEYVAFAMS